MLCAKFMIADILRYEESRSVLKYEDRDLHGDGTCIIQLEFVSPGCTRAEMTTPARSFRGVPVSIRTVGIYAVSS